MDGLIETSGEKDVRQRFTLDYGLTDKIGLRLRTTHDDFSDHHAKLTRTEFAIKYELAEKNELLIDTGLYLDYYKNYGSDINDNIQIRLLLAKDLEQWQHTANIILNKRFGESFGNIDYGFRFKNIYKLDKTNKVGVEYYGSYGDLNDGFSAVDENKHFFGPAWLHDFEEYSLKSELAVHFGITRPAEPTTLKWKLSYSF